MIHNKIIHNTVRTAVLLFVLLLTSATAWADITINSTADWNTFATAVGNGTTYSGQKVTLTANITVTTMVGNANRKFSGTFYGCGHTLTFNATATGNGCAPFFAIDGATFKCLRVAGTINTSYAFAAGIAAHSYGNCTIQSCQSSITINSSKSGDGTHAGFVAVKDNGSLTFSNCLMDGSITGSSTTNCGGFVGWRSDGALTFDNCLMAGALSISLDSNSATFNRNGGSTLNNCYYKGSYTNATLQGTATSATGSALQTQLGSGWKVSGSSVVPDVDTKNLATAIIAGIDNIYYGGGSNISIDYTVRAADGTLLTKGTHYTETFSPAIVREPGDYTLTITAKSNSGYSGSQTISFTVTDYINMPTSGTTNFYFSQGVNQIHIYDDGGKDGNYSDGSYGCLVLNAPDGYMIELSGTVDIGGGDYLSIYNSVGAIDNDRLAIYDNDWNYYGDIEPVTSTGRYMTLLFTSDSDNGSNWVNFKGFDLIATLVSTTPEYDITVNTATGGSVVSDKSKAKFEDQVTLTATPSEGYMLNGISVSGGVRVNGGWYTNNIATFSMPASAVSVTPTFTTARTAAGGLYINMPYSSITTVTIPSDVKSFKFYDDGGRDGNYSPSCYNILVLTAPVGYVLQLSGNVLIHSDDRLSVYDNNTVGGTALLYNINGDVNITTVTSSSRNMTFEFISNHFENNTAAGFDLTVTIIPDPADFSDDGSGVYTIRTAKGWDFFCDALQDDDTYNRFSGKTVKLGANIGTAQEPVTRWAGSSGHEFQGTFDGQGNTLTVNYSSNSYSDTAAPLSYVSGATIRNLIVTGNCGGTYGRAAGIVGESASMSTITNCISSVTLSGGPFLGGISIGGLVDIKGCIYNGRINTTDRSGGFVGFAMSTTSIANSLFDPQEGSTISDNKAESGTFYTVSNNGVTLQNCYYTRALGTPLQGKAPRTVTGGERVTISDIALTGTETAYSVSGITAYSNGGIKRTVGQATTLYYGSGDNVSLTLSHGDRTGYNFSAYTASNGGTLNGTENPYTLTMPDADVTVTCTFTDMFGMVNGADGSAEHPYIISTADGWNYFCDALQDNATWNRFSGKTVKLDANIEVSRMAGSSGHDFCGTFDGDDHTLTFNYGTSGTPASVEYIAPFSYVSNTKANPSDADDSPATIMNLHVKGDIYTSAKYAAGIVGQHWGTLNIENCRSSIVIHSSVVNNDGNDGTHGGIEAVSSGVLKITGCVFDGKLLTTNATTKCGGFVAWGNGTFSNCLYAPAALADGETEVQTGTGDHPSATFIRNGSAGTNCYYTRTLGTAQGKAAHTITAGTGVNVSDIALTGTETAYSVSGITAYSHGGIKRTVGQATTLYYGIGDQVSLTLSNTATVPTGYKFGGYTANNGGTLSGTENLYTLTMPDADVTVSAVMTPITYTVHFDGNGNTGGSMSDQTFTYDVEQQLTANAFSRTGYTFAGWNTLANGSGDSYTDEQSVSNLVATDGGSVTLYAQWTLTPIAYIDENGEEQTCTDYTVITDSDEPISLIGGKWYVVNDNVTIYDGSGFTINGGAANIILCDNKRLDYQSLNNGYINGSLNIYGQKEGTGVFYGRGVSDNDSGEVMSGNLTIYGGHVSIYGNGAEYSNTQYGINGDVTMYGGSLYVQGGSYYHDAEAGIFGNVTMYGGSLDAHGGGRADGVTFNVTLDWSSATDRFYASSVGGTVTIADGKAFTDGTNIYSGTIENQTSALAGKTLAPCLALADTDDNTTTIADHAGHTIAVTLQDRTLYKDGAWNTLCLPFNLVLEGSSLAGAEARTLTSASIDGSTLNLAFGEPVEELTAGTPYIIKWTKANDYVDDEAHNIVNPVFTGVTIDATTNDVEFTGGSFKGTYDSRTYESGDKSILFLGAENTLYWPQAGASIKAQRAYFQLSDGAGVREFKLRFGDEDEITGITTTDNTEKADAWYDLNGRRLQGKPMKNGLYIHGGRKVIVGHKR